jgi:DedD protein
MEPALKTRLIGALVLIALAVIIVPMFFSGGSPPSDNGKTLSLALPASPDQELTTRTMSVAPPSSAAMPANAATASASGDDQLATVDIPSRRPPDVHPENDAQPAQTPPAAQAPTKPATQAPAAPAKPAPKPAPSKPKPTAQQPASAPGQAADGAYRVNLGAYSDTANARSLVERVRKLGYGVQTDKVTISGKVGARVSAGPFATRAAAETARLRLKQAIPGAPASVVSSAHDQKGDAPASALPAGRAGGWAVQIGAYSHKADATALRDKLRKAGFDGFVDDVRSGGRTLWRVRVGPQTQRADAEKVRRDLQSKLKLGGVVVTVP